MHNKIKRKIKLLIKSAVKGKCRACVCEILVNALQWPFLYVKITERISCVKVGFYELSDAEKRE